jgi:hypothetical protein
MGKVRECVGGGGGGHAALLEGSQACFTRPSDKSRPNMKMKTCRMVRGSGFLKEQDLRLHTAFISFRIGTNVCSCEAGAERLGSS